MTALPSLNRWTKQSDSNYKISNLFKYVPVDYMIILELYIGIGEVWRRLFRRKDKQQKMLLVLIVEITNNTVEKK